MSTSSTKFSKLSAQDVREMRDDAASAERRRAFALDVPARASIEENLEELWTLLARLEPLTRDLPPRRAVTLLETIRL